MGPYIQLMDTFSSPLAGATSVVVKLGSQLLTDAGGRLDASYMASVARQVEALGKAGTTVTIVSSGAIAAGVAELGLAERPADLAALQAVAAVGQRRLMDAWAASFAPLGRHVAQLLLTRDDLDDRQRFLNLRNTVSAVHALGAVPVINENDTVSTDELVRISFGDNDILAAAVATAIRAEVLVLLSVTDGLLDAGGAPLRRVEAVADVESLVWRHKSARGKGGMNSKLAAARTVTAAGECLVVAHGRTERVLERLLAGEALGTLFCPTTAGRRTGRGRWIGAARPAGAILLDAGAARAVAEEHRSLLPIGVTGVEGEFGRGDVVALRGPDGRTVARGLTNYAAADVLAVRGKRSAEARGLLGAGAYDEVVHRDNLVVP